MNYFSFALSAALLLAQPLFSVAQNATIDAESSTVEWAAGKIVGGDHNGTIGINKGSLAYLGILRCEVFSKNGFLE